MFTKQLVLEERLVQVCEIPSHFPMQIHTEESKGVTLKYLPESLICLHLDNALKYSVSMCLFWLLF